jgi:hypothetical protein
VKVGGGFNFRMEARNKGAGFDFLGSYTKVSPREHLHCLLGDGRHLDTRFAAEAGRVRIVEEFDAETGQLSRAPVQGLAGHPGQLQEARGRRLMALIVASRRPSPSMMASKLGTSPKSISDMAE